MQAVLKVIDEEPGKGRGPAFRLHLASERITARELIRRRVLDEIRALQKQAADRAYAHSFLVRPGDDAVESRLNPPRKARRRTFNEEEEMRIALDAFDRKRFLILFDDRQIDDPDEELIVTPDSEAVFLRLVPLVGG